MPHRKTCLTCRSRKIRCDGEQPSCKRCVKSKRSCSYSRPRQNTFSFRHSELSALVAPLTSEGSNRGSPPLDTEDRDQPIQNTHLGISSPSSLTTPGATHRTELEVEVSPGVYRSSIYSPVGPSVEEHVTSSKYSPRPQALSSLEGELLHFFVQNIGPWLDVTSPERYYTYMIPQIAQQSLLLHRAIMACSAHIMRLLDTSKVYLADIEEEYQSACVGLLIPIINDASLAVQGEEVLATITILRMSEQFDEYNVDRQYHLVPAVFPQLRQSVVSSTVNGGALQATFYSYVRADIRMAILGQCQTKLHVDSWPLDESSPSSDADWANRITWLLVHVINLCYGSDKKEVFPLDRLHFLIDQWKENLPTTFTPYMYEESENAIFPVIRLLCPWHIVGLQFYHTCKVLLGTHFCPQEVFYNALSFNKYLTSSVLPHARTLCAISFSNDHFGCRINASGCIAAGARLFTGREERTLIEAYFDMLQNKHSWPSRACIELLREAWALAPA